MEHRLGATKADHDWRGLGLYQLCFFSTESPFRYVEVSSTQMSSRPINVKR